MFSAVSQSATHTFSLSVISITKVLIAINTLWWISEMRFVNADSLATSQGALSSSFQGALISICKSLLTSCIILEAYTYYGHVRDIQQFSKKSWNLLKPYLKLL